MIIIDIYIPLWLYYNCQAEYNERRIVTIYIPLWLYYNNIATM